MGLALCILPTGNANCTTSQTANTRFMSDPNSPPKQATPEPKPAPKARKPRQLRIGEREITAICELLSQRLTEREALQVLGIREATWYRWKSRAKNTERLGKLLDRITGAKIKTHLANIEDGAVGAGPHKRADWRASQAILAIIDRNRYGNQPPPTEPTRQPAVSPRTINFWITTAQAQEASGQPSGQIEDTWTEPRLLAEKTSNPAEPAPARKGKVEPPAPAQPEPPEHPL
jgi:hypothetical protein